MTSFGVADATDADLLDRIGVSATYEYIALLNRKRERLQAGQVAAEEQFLHRLGIAYSEQRMTEEELAIAYRAYSKTAVSGFMKRWNAAIGVPAGRMQYILRNLDTLNRHVPNMPDGTWRGAWPLADDQHVPAYGTCVVYVLYDEANSPCYVGSTQDFAGRLKAHRKAGKQFAVWTAFACADRQAAYLLEEQLLAEHMPYLNKKRGR